MSDEEPVSNNAASKLDVHEAYQVLLKVIKAKNMFMMNMKTSGKMTAESWKCHNYQSMLYSLREDKYFMG